MYINGQKYHDIMLCCGTSLSFMLPTQHRILGKVTNKTVAISEILDVDLAQPEFISHKVEDQAKFEVRVALVLDICWPLLCPS